MLLRVWCKRRRRPRVVRHRIGEAHRSILESTSNCTSPRLTSVCARGRRGLPSLIMGLLSCKSRLFKLGSIRWFGCNYTSSGQVHNIIAAVKFNIKSPIGANRSNSGGMVSMLRWVPSQHFLTDAELRICCLAIPYRKDQLSQHLQKVSARRAGTHLTLHGLKRQLVKSTCCGTEASLIRGIGSHELQCACPFESWWLHLEGSVR